MQKFFKYSLLYLLLYLIVSINLIGQTVIYSTNFGTNAGVYSIPLNNLPGWTASGDNPIDVNLDEGRPSLGYSTPIAASGIRALYHASGNSIRVGTGIATLSGAVNTTSYANIQVSFAYWAAVNYSGTVTFQWSSDGNTWNNILFSYSPDETWRVANSGNWINLPVGASGQTNLRFRFTFNITNVFGAFRIDDFTVRGTCAPLSISLAKTNGNCNTLSLSGASSAYQIQWQKDGTTLSTVNQTYVSTGITVAGGNGIGSAANQLNGPYGLYVDGNDNLYVADAKNNRVLKFAPGVTTGVVVAGGNGAGSGASQLDFPTGVFVDATGNVFVTDENNHRIQKWAVGAITGTTVAGGNGLGNAANQFYQPRGNVYVDTHGSIYIADLQNHRVQKWIIRASSGTTVAGGNGLGSNANQLSYPQGVYVDKKNGDIYVSDQNNNRVQKWAVSANSGTTVAGGSRGAGANHLMYPYGVYIDAVGNLFVCDPGNRRVQKWAVGASTGTTVVNSNDDGTTVPTNMYLDASGNIIVTDVGNHRIQKWGTTITTTYTPSVLGTYTAFVTDMNGCSTTSNAIILDSIKTSLIDTTICNQPSYKSPSGKIITTASTFKDTVRYTAGCDSAYYNINVKFLTPQTVSAINASICSGESYTLPYSRKVVTTAGTYKDTLRTSQGCDSLTRTIILTVNTCNTTQNPLIVWQKTIGGTQLEELNDLIKTADGGYIAAGLTYSTDGDITTREYSSTSTTDAIMFKINSTGNIVWQKAFGGSSNDQFGSISLNTDGGYILGGTSESNNGSPGGNYGRTDVFLVRTDDGGNKIWSSHYGGSNGDATASALQGSDGSFVFTAWSYSADGQVNQNHDSRFGLRHDFWNAKVNSSGTAFINRSVLGGAGQDYPAKIRQTKDGGYIVAGFTESLDGDITGYHGTTEQSGINDFWVVKLNSALAITNNRAFGGTSDDKARDIIQTSDGGYLVVGYTESSNGDVPFHRGGGDILVLKLDANLGITWSKTFGGSQTDDANVVKQTSDGGYIIGGYTKSSNQDAANSGYHGGLDYWILKLDSQGNLKNQVALGGAKDETVKAIEIADDGDYIIAGYSNSNDGDVTGNKGNSDGWVVKLSLCGKNVPSKAVDTTICNQPSYKSPSGKTITTASIFKDTVRAITGCDSIYFNINLKFLNRQNRPDTIVTICKGSTYTLPYKRQVVSTVGTYPDTLFSSKGCDSLIRNIILKIVNPISKSDTTVAICQGSNYTLPYSKKIVINAGQYLDTLRTTQGCDTLFRKINVFFTPKQVKNDTTVTICEGKSYTLPYSMKVVNMAKIYGDTLQTTQGCDSLVRNITLKITTKTINPDTSVSICEGSSFVLPYSRKVVRDAITYGDTLRNTEGCDILIHNVILKIKSKQSLAPLAVTICQGKNYILPFSRKIYTQTGTYPDTLRSIEGCDSLVRVVNLTVIQSQSRPDTTVFICQGKNFNLPYSRKLINQAGTHGDTLRNTQGCDYLIRNIILKYKTPQILNIVNKTICFGESETLPYKGRKVTTAGTYQDTLFNSEGCDSLIYTLKLSVYKPTINIISVQGCYNTPKIYNNKTYTPQKNTGLDTLKGVGVYGCDSVIQVVVTFDRVVAVDDAYVLNVDKTIDTTVNVTINDNIIGDYKLSIEESLKIGTAKAKNNREIQLTVPSNYASGATFSYKICSENCSNQCSVGKIVLAFKKDNDANFKEEPIIITPNGDGLNDNLVIEGIEAFPQNNLTVINRWGQQVYFAKPYKNEWSGTNQSGEPLPDGTYFYSVNLNLNDRKVIWGSITIKTNNN